MCRQFNKVMSKLKFQTSKQFEGAEYDKPWSYFWIHAKNDPSQQPVSLRSHIKMKRLKIGICLEKNHLFT